MKNSNSVHSISAKDSRSSLLIGTFRGSGIYNGEFPLDAFTVTVPTSSQEEAQSAPPAADLDLRDVDTGQIVQHPIISDLNFSTASLRAHNESLPISQFPNEMLENIFDFCLDGWEWQPRYRTIEYSYNHRTFTRLYPGWIQLTHICSRWRRVAIGYPRLWSTIVYDSKQWFDLCIKRLPPKQIIDVTLQISGDQVAQTIFSQIGRIRTLDIEGSQCRMCHVLDGLTGPAPALEKMSLTIRYRFGDSGPLIIPTNFIESAFRLTELTLDGVWIRDGSYTLASLKHLTAKSYVTISKLQSLLQRVPHLRSANIEKINGSPSRINLDSIVIVTLPDLQTLRATFFPEYSTGEPGALHLLPHLYLPSLACLHLVNHLHNTSLEVTNHITAFMLRFLGQPNALPRSFRSTVLYYGGKKTKRLQCSSWAEGGRTINSPPEDLLGPVQLSFGFGYTWHAYGQRLDILKLRQFLDSIFRLMPLTDVQTLTLDMSGGEFSVSDWLSALETLSQVEEVTVYAHYDFADFLRAATPPVGWRSGGFLFPCLKRLVVKSTTRARRGGVLAHAIHPFIEGRRLANLQLEQLDLHTSRFWSRLNRRLYGKVNLTWNGKKFVPHVIKTNDFRAAADSLYGGGQMHLDERSME